MSERNLIAALADSTQPLEELESLPQSLYLKVKAARNAMA